MFSCVRQWNSPTEYDWEFEEEYEDRFHAEDLIFCDVCDVDLYSQESYEHHLSEHKTCNINGCQYTAHMSLIEKHIESQHLTGLYEKIRNVNTPEAIAKWIEDRKVKYPTKENVQKRYEKQSEMFKRGEKIGERRNRFGRDKTRMSKQKRTTKRKKMETTKVQKKESLIDEKCDWNGTMFPFRGTKDLYNTEEEKEMSDYDDDEWSAEVPSTSSVQINNALGALMGAYMSDDDDDDGPPVEQKIEKKLVEYPIEQEVKKEVEKPKRTRVRTKPVKNSFPKPKFHKRKVTLLEKLLDSEIRHERNVLLQCVQFVVSNNFFRNE